MRRAIWALVLSLAFETGCQGSIPRLVARGEYQAAATAAARSKRPPRGRSARALAEALAALGRVEEARAVLLRDFRTSGDARSMIALAELEASLGLVGVAAAHFTRAAALSPEALRGHPEMCALLRRRAQAYAALGESVAGDQDMRRVALLCEASAGDAAIAAGLRAQATRDVRALRTLRAGDPGSSGAAASEPQRGGHAMRRSAAAAVDATEVIGLLAAELRGELGVDLVSNDELRGWVGEGAVEALSTALEAATSEATRAYVRLRLGRLGSSYSLPSVAGEAGSEAALVTRVLEALEVEGEAALGWRVLVILGDLGGAEMMLGEGLQARHKALSGAGPWAPAQTRAPTPSHWAGKVMVAPSTLEALLVLARMRGAAGNEAQALEIARYALAEAMTRGIAGAHEMGMIEAHHALASGRPWYALALVDATSGGEDVAAAAAAAILLGRAACEDRCGEAADRAVVERVLDEGWVVGMEGRLLGLATARSFAAAPGSSGCVSASEALTEDAVGDVAAAMRLAQRSDSQGAEAAIRAAIESDLAMVCAGRLLTPWMAARGQRVGAKALAQMLSQTPETVAAGALLLQGELALVAGDGEQASVMLTAAAASTPTPTSIWERAAWFARLVDAREVELLALRELLLHGVSGEARVEARRALLIRGVRDANAAWAVRQREAGREALERAVADYLVEVPAPQRWQAREQLAIALSEERWADDEAGAIVRAAVWPAAELARLHPAANARLEAALSGRRPALRADPMAPSELALAAAEPPFTAPRTMRLLPAAASVVLHGALAIRADSAGRRAAISAATTGEPAAREAALRALLVGLNGEPTRRAAVEALVAAGMPALASGTGEVEAMVRGSEGLLRLRIAAEVVKEPAAERAARP